MDIQRLRVDIEAASEGELRKQTFCYLLDRVVRPPGRRLLDLGAGGCIFARLAVRRGFEVVAVDGRTVRLPPPAELKSITFVKSDVRRFDVRGFDAVLILGLLYHLEIPDQIDLLRRCQYAPVVMVDTQVHDPQRATDQMRLRSLGGLIRRQGYTGVEFLEYNSLVNVLFNIWRIFWRHGRLQRERPNPMAAIGNRRSFWHTEESLLKLFSDCGYERVVLVDPPYVSKYGMRRFYLLGPALDLGAATSTPGD